MASPRLCLCASIAAILVSPVQSLYLEGSLNTQKPWNFITKFGIGVQGGHLEYQLPTGHVSNSTYVVLYKDHNFDQSTHKLDWDQVYGNDSLSCQQKMDNGYTHKVKTWPVLNEPFKIGAGARDHMYYIVIVDCVNYLSLDAVQYSLHLTQANGDEVSIDQAGLDYTWLFCSFASLMLLVVWLVGVNRNEPMRLNPLISLLLLMESLACIINCHHYMQYRWYGIDAVSTLIGASLCHAVCEAILVFLMLVVSKGWLITRNTIDHQLLITLAMVWVWALRVLMICLYHYQVDPASTAFMFDSITGYVLIAINFIMLGWCLKELRCTLSTDLKASKRKFFLSFGCFVIFWLLSPLLVVIIAEQLDAWVRLKVTETVVGFIRILGAAAFAGLLWPSWSHLHFDYVNVSTAVEQHYMAAINDGI